MPKIILNPETYKICCDSCGKEDNSNEIPINWAETSANSYIKRNKKTTYHSVSVYICDTCLQTNCHWILDESK